MSAIFPTVTLDPIRLRLVDDGTGNDVSVPETFTIPATDYSESIGMGGMQVDLQIKNANASGGAASGAAEAVLIETHTDQEFTGTPVVTEEYGTVPFESIPAQTSVTVRNIEAVGQHIRINNTSTVPVEVSVWYKPNR